MTMKSAPYYWAECDHDGCIEVAPSMYENETDGFAEVSEVNSAAIEAEWIVTEDGKHFCRAHTVSDV